MKIKTNYRGKGKMFPGTIKRDNRDGTYDITYDDGDREMGVREADIQAEAGGGGGVDGKIREGDKVEARYRGKSRYYPGKISRDRGDGTYDIDYEDGEREQRVGESLIRSLESGGRDSSPSRGGGTRLEEGMKIKANYRGKGKMFPGTIKRDNRDGTYDINYDDGDREMGVREADIQAGGGSLREGSRVEARYRGKSRWYPGKISRDHRNGSYDIDYDDGEKELRVTE